MQLQQAHKIEKAERVNKSLLVLILEEIRLVTERDETRKREKKEVYPLASAIIEIQPRTLTIRQAEGRNNLIL